MPIAAVVADAKGPHMNKSTEIAPRCAADLACPIERNRRCSQSYIEDFAIKGESKMRCRWDARSGSYSCAGPNVLLSAVIGKAALRVLTALEVEVHVTRFNADEVEEYLPRMAAKYRLPLELVELQWRLLPLHVHHESSYRDQLARARRDLESRDPDDAHPLALARTLGLPLWSNDRDLEGHGVECFTTARLLASIEGSSERRSG